MGVEYNPVARYAAEFIGTFVLVFTIGCNVLSGQPVWGGVSIACVLTVMIYALGKSSGANFNPAVSLALGIANKLEWKEVGIYSAVQCVAGLCARVCYSLLFNSNGFELHPTPGHNIWQAGLAEFLYTFMLCFVVLNVAASKMHAGRNQFYGLAIGFVIVAGAYSGGSVSMGCFNPAVVLGIHPHEWGIIPAYWTFELLGAGVAAGLFLFCRPEEEDPAAEIDPENHSYKLPQRLVSEFLGTYMLVLTVGLNVLSGSPAGAFSIAASLMCMIFALGSLSGAHFNPAVTTAIVCSSFGREEKCSIQDGAAYMGVQILGGVAASFTYSAMMNFETFALKPEAYGWGAAIIAEFVFTFVLAFVVLSVATVKSALTEYFGFAIGMCVTVGGFAIGKVSGGSLNPAVSIGISTSHLMGGGVFYACLIYTVVEVLAGVAAAGVFRVTQPSEYEDENEKKPLTA